MGYILPQMRQIDCLIAIYLFSLFFYKMLFTNEKYLRDALFTVILLLIYVDKQLAMWIFDYRYNYSN